MKIKITLLFLLITTIGFAQINFEPGYFITNDGAKTECLIKNLAWQDNPTEFDYKLTADAEPKKATISTVAEINVNGYKFVRYTVDIDRSSKFTGEMTFVKEPEYKKETLFLKTLVEGKANLYVYEYNNLVKYFYSVAPHNTAQQLLYKEYRVGSSIKENNLYKQQLFNIMRTPNNNVNDFKDVAYKRESLVKLFVNYNGNSGEVKNLAATQNKGYVNFKITPGVSLATVEVINTARGNQNINHTFKSEPVFRIGFEAEYVMPFNNNKWSIFTDPNVQFYKASEIQTTTVYEIYEVERAWEAKYNFLELPFGVRHYMFLNEKSKFFVDLSYALAFELGDGTIKYNNAQPLETSKSSNFALGAGYSYSRYSAQLKYSFGRGILGDVINWDASYNSLGLILGYRVF